MSRLLSRGCQGEDVRAVQDGLNYHIRRGVPLKVDGIFGPKTEVRLREFQRVNSLRVDGVFGPLTREKLFGVDQIEATIIAWPRLKLSPSSFPSIGAPKPFRGQSLAPRFQLELPGVGGLHLPSGVGPLLMPPYLLPGLAFRLSEASRASLPSLDGQGFIFHLKPQVPPRNDPADPYVSSYERTVQLIRSINVPRQLQDWIVTMVPKPITRLSPPGAGFGWGASPLFNPLDPTGFGAKVNASYAFLLSQGRNGLPTIGFGAWGQARCFLNFETRDGEARPRVELEGGVFMGLKGTF